MKSPIIEASTTVSLTNVSPVISPIADQTIKEGEIFSIQASATDPDGTSGDIRFSLGSNLPGVFIHPVTGIISWNSSEFDGGTVLSVVVVATDGGVPPAVANEPFTITIADENSVPVISQVGPQSLQSTGLLIVDVDAVDGDSPTQQITFELTDAPAGAGINPSNGVVTWTPAPAQAGASHVFTVKAKDSGTPQKAALMSFAVNVVTPADRAPVFTGVPVVLWVKGTTYSLNVHASDPDGDPITLATNLTTTAGATFADQGGGTGQLAWNTTAANVGTYQVPVAATANGATTHATVSIRVEQDELYWNWAKESFGVLASSFNLALLDMNADPDGDGRGNIHEMTFLTNPVVQDTAPLSMTMEQEGPFSILNFKMHRRVGSERYVQLGLAGSTNMLGAWEPIPPTEWFAAVDVDGDDDSRPESESVEFQLYEYHPGGLPKGHFYRVQSSVLPGTP